MLILRIYIIEWLKKKNNVLSEKKKKISVIIMIKSANMKLQQK